MREILLSYPDEVARAMRGSPEQQGAEILLMAAIKMFEIGRLSTGRAAELARLSIPEFLDACARYRVSAFNYPDEDIAFELQSDLNALDAACEPSG